MRIMSLIGVPFSFQKSQFCTKNAFVCWSLKHGLLGIEANNSVLYAQDAIKKKKQRLCCV